MSQNTKTIYSSEVAGLLCRRGFRIIETGINARKPWLNTFIFEDTTELREALDIIFKNKKKKN